MTRRRGGGAGGGRCRITAPASPRSTGVRRLDERRAGATDRSDGHGRRRRRCATRSRAARRRGSRRCSSVEQGYGDRLLSNVVRAGRRAPDRPGTGVPAGSSMRAPFTGARSRRTDFCRMSMSAPEVDAATARGGEFGLTGRAVSSGSLVAGRASCAEANHVSGRGTITWDTPSYNVWRTVGPSPSSPLYSTLLLLMSSLMHKPSEYFRTPFRGHRCSVLQSAPAGRTGTGPGRGAMRAVMPGSAARAAVAVRIAVPTRRGGHGDAREPPRLSGSRSPARRTSSVTGIAMAHQMQTGTIRTSALRPAVPSSVPVASAMRITTTVIARKQTTDASQRTGHGARPRLR